MKIQIAVWSALLLGAFGTMSVAQGKSRALSPQLSGLYRGFPAVAQFGAAVGQSYVFSARGEVHKGWVGTQLVQNFDFARAAKSQPQNTGKYSITRDKITFRWNDKTSETAPFSLRRDPKTGKTHTAIGSSFYYKIVPWNKILDGTFVPHSYQGGFADGPQRLVDNITFTRAGQFSVKNDDALTTLQGRYKVSGAALTLMPSNGTKRIHSLHVFEDHQNPPGIFLIDGRPFARK